MIQGAALTPVSNSMSKRVVTIDVNDSMQDAMKRMKEKDIRMLPVG